MINTITIESGKPEDIFFINELAKRLHLKAKVTTDTILERNRQVVPNPKKEDEKLAEMAFLTSSAALEGFFENEPEKMF